MNEQANKPFEEVQVSDTAIWRWVREGDLYVSRMTQESMEQFKRDVEQGRKELGKPEQEPVCDKDPSLCGFVQCQLGKICKIYAAK